MPASDSVSFILFYLLAFQCLYAVIICLPDMDRMRCGDYLPAGYGPQECFGPTGVDVDNTNVLIVEIDTHI